LRVRFRSEPARPFAEARGLAKRTRRTPGIRPPHGVVHPPDGAISRAGEPIEGRIVVVIPGHRSATTRRVFADPPVVRTSRSVVGRRIILRPIPMRAHPRPTVEPATGSISEVEVT